MKIAFVLEFLCGSDAAICGISKTYDLYIEKLYELGHEIIIFSSFNANSIGNYYLNRNIKVTAYKLSSVSFFWNPNKVIDNTTSNHQKYFFCKNTFKDHYIVFSSLLKQKPDIVHCVLDVPSTAIFSLYCFLFDIPIVSVLHSNAEYLFFKQANLLGYSKVYNLFHKYLSYTHDSIATRSDSFSSYMKNKYNWKFDKLITPHVNSNIFYYNKERCESDYILNLKKKLTFNSKFPILYLYVGRVDKDKDIQTIVELLAPYTDCYLTIIGGGTLSNHFLKMHGEDTRIYSIPRFLSHEELVDYYYAADYHISASQMETLGNTAIESISCGTPVITPRACGFMNSIKENKSGFMWEPNNNKNADEVIQKSRNFFIKTEIAEKTLEHVNDFSYKNTIDQLEKWYKFAIEYQRSGLEKVFYIWAVFSYLFVIDVICIILQFYKFFNKKETFDLYQLTDIVI